jgi:hypothetical protein
MYPMRKNKIRWTGTTPKITARRAPKRKARRAGLFIRVFGFE